MESSLMSEYLFSMDTKNRSKNLDVKYLHPFSPSPSHNGHRHNPGAEGELTVNEKHPKKVHFYLVEISEIKF